MNTNLKIERLVRMANGNEKLMDGTTAQVELILQSADLVYGVFKEPGSPNGVGTVLIKGRLSLEAIAAGTAAVPLRVTAIKTVDRNMAIAAHHQLGDGRNEAIRFSEDSE